jgi:hypothetical protein
MNYTVVWEQEAEDALALLWTNAADQAAVTSAADAIDRLLARDPYGHGESRSAKSRILFVPPLVVLYTVSDSNRTVYVTAVGLSRP